MGRTSSKRGPFFLIRRCPDLMVGVAGNSICRLSRLFEVKWVDGWNGGASAVRTSGWEGRLTDEKVRREGGRDGIVISHAAGG